MSFLRVLAERSLLLLLLVSRIALVALGLAVLGATFAFGGFLRAENASPVILSAWRWIQLTGGLFLAAGVLLFIFRSWIQIPRAGIPGAGRPSWIYLIALCLAGQVVVGVLASEPIRSLWQDAIPALRQAGVFEQATSTSEMSGLVLAPVTAVMLVPSARDGRSRRLDRRAALSSSLIAHAKPRLSARVRPHGDSPGGFGRRSLARDQRVQRHGRAVAQRDRGPRRGSTRGVPASAGRTAPHPARDRTDREKLRTPALAGSHLDPGDDVLAARRGRFPGRLVRQGAGPGARAARSRRSGLIADCCAS